jgi:chloramphenicol 3-O phosphotransferase
MLRAVVVLLNGASSSGKTSTAQALQGVWPRPLLHAGIDLFTRMLPIGTSTYDPAPGTPAWQGFRWITGTEDGAPVVRLETGPFAEKITRDMRRTLAYMAGLGHDLVVDEILLRREWLDDYRALMAGHDLRLVGLRCPLEILLTRERQRPRGIPGQARGTWLAAHQHCTYDLEVDTAELSPLECARVIVERLKP